MAWIQDRSDLGASEVGCEDNILRVHALHPEGLAGHLALYEAVMCGTPSLRKVERELIAFVVSQANACHY